MSDIVERLRAWVYTDSQYATAREAADEIERLRLSPRADCPEPENAANEDKVSMRQNMTVLTPLERCVLREVRHGYADIDDVRCKEIAYVIDRLLSRAGSNDETAGEDAAKCAVKSKKCPDRERVAAGESKAVAWVAFATDGSESRYVSASQEQARSVADDYNWCIAPLFAGLSAEEREALKWAYDILCERAGQLQASGNIAASTPFVQSARALQGLWLRGEVGESQ